MATNLPTFAEFDLQPRDTAPTRFEKYLTKLSNLFVAMDINNAARKKAMLLHYVGDEMCDIFETLTIPDPGDDSDVYKVVTKAFVDHFEPQRCTDHYVYNFRKEDQKASETVAEFYTRLNILARKCDFHDSTLEIKRQIISGTTNSRLRRKVIEQSLTLDQLLKSARAMDIAEGRSNDLDINVTHSGKRHYEKHYDNHHDNRKSVPNKDNHRQTCGLCGGYYPHSRACPAQGKMCSYCGRLNHYERVCRVKKRDNQPKRNNQHFKSKPTKKSDSCRAVETTSDSEEKTSSIIHETSDDDNYTFHVSDTTNIVVNDKPLFNVKIMNTSLEVMADSGASVSIVSFKDYNRLKSKPELLQSKSKVFPYMSSKPLNLIGKFQATISTDKYSCKETFYVVDGPSRSILSWKLSQKLQLIKVANVIGDEEVGHNILDDFPTISGPIGACKCEPVKVHVDKSVKPVTQPHRRVPFHVRNQVEEKLLELQEADIIEPAEGPSTWISPIVIVPKPNNPKEIRICVDMREANRAIIRERHVIPTIDDVIADLNGCTVFSKIDLKQGYHQILLHPDSRNLTTFSSHIGLWRYKRLNFGMSCSAEIFQKTISDIISGISGVRNISDDIYIGGKNIDEHDDRLRQVLRRLTDSNLRVNIDKCKLRVSSMLFFGHMFSEKGISPDPKKVKHIRELNPPTSVTEVRSLLSSASFCSRYVKDFALITRPLRKLTHKDEPWKWDTEESKSFDDLKNALTESTTLGYFDPDKQTVIYTDGSPIGVGAVLTQIGEDGESPIPLHYASYPLSATEARYPQIDREALSIYWAIKKFHLYVYGKDFKVVTDHKPLVSLFNNPSSKPSLRIERWLMELQRYRFTVEYQPGKDNPADYASRHPSPDATIQNREEIADIYISYVSNNAVPKAMTMQEINTATVNDPLLQAVISCLKTGKWYNAPSDVSISELSRFEKIKSELTFTEPDLVLKSNRIVIPTTLQERTVDIAHEAHLGVAKSKSLIREKVWFPLMDKLIERKVKSCLPCQIATPVSSREPLKMTPLPGRAFELTSIDFAHIEGETVMLLVDDYSRYPFVEPVTSTSASAVIPKLDQIFAMFGTPETVKSDNGPPFNGEEFARFAKVFGFTHRKVTPLWPRANGEVERFVQTLKKNVKVAKSQNINWKKALQAFLRGYRSTPHCTTGVPPATLFLKREMKTKLPSVIEDDAMSKVIRVRDSERKQKMKEYADREKYVIPSDLKVGDTVLVKTPFNMTKGGLPYQPTPLTVTSRKGTMITATNNDRQVTRNSSFFKRIPDNIQPEPDDLLSARDDLLDDTRPQTPEKTLPNVAKSPATKQTTKQSD